MVLPRRPLALLVAAAAWLIAPSSDLDWVAPAQAAEMAKDKKSPRIVLERLTFPAMLGGRKYESFLRKRLGREVREVSWGASADSTIEYRFTVEKLGVRREGDVLRVSCRAIGTLPGGRTARSQLSFGGSPSQHSKLIRRVLEIVARGVVSRLAEMERVRRGHLPDARVRAPAQ